MPDSEVEIIDLTQTDSSSSDDGEDDTSDVGSAISSETSEAEDDFVMDDSTRAQLHVAIASVSETRLRQIVALVVDTMPEAELFIARELVTIRKRKHPRPVPRFEECINCGAEFDLQDPRVEDECKVHPGDLEVDEECFPDHDEDCHGPMDTEENRRQFPQFFLWSCCEGDGTSPGCVEGLHSSDGSGKRRRVSFAC